MSVCNNMKTLDDLKNKLTIDEHALEIALREHPQLMYDAGMQLATSISQRDESKQKLDEIEALVDKELRQAAATSGEKTTEKEIESNKKLDKRVKAANDDFLESKLTAQQWQVLKDSFEQRSYALSKLVDLYIANYYSTIERKSDVDLKTVQSQRVKQALVNKRVRP